MNTSFHDDDRTIIALASGGTGGHIFPAESLAAELERRGHRPILITDKRHADYSGTKTDLEVQTIHAGTTSGSILRKMAGVASLGIGYLQARYLLRKIKPAVVVGFGGYPSFPTMMAATKKKLPTIIHEQNSMLGKANFVLAPRVNVIATSFPEVNGVRESDMHKVVLTGNPVRSGVQALRNLPYPELQEDGVLRLLVTGGSQGAGVFSDVVPEAIALLPEELRHRIRVDQQCRKDNLERVRKRYAELGVSADLSGFFTDIPARLASAHLVIARSGASTLAELAVAGRPVVMVPYPYAKDDHQTVNARALEDAGGGWLMPEDAFTPEALAERLERSFALPSTLKEKAERAREALLPDADKRLANMVESLIGE